MAMNVPVRMIIMRAYAQEDFQIVGGPAWMNSARFDISAKAATSASAEQLSSMLRSLLAERFRFSSHSETRDLPRYVLVVAKKDGRLGPSLRRSDVDCDAIAAAAAGKDGGPPAVRAGESPPCSIAAGGFGLGHWAARDKPWPDITASLSKLIGRTVVDGTGLKGSFSADLNWSPDQATQDPDPNGPSIFTAIEEQIGLRVESRKGPVEVRVIDRMELPTEN